MLFQFDPHSHAQEDFPSHIFGMKLFFYCAINPSRQSFDSQFITKTHPTGSTLLGETAMKPEMTTPTRTSVSVRGMHRKK